MNGTPRYESLKTPWFNAMTCAPLRPGPYEVRNSILMHPLNRNVLQGPRVRYWDGEEWHAIWVYSKFSNLHHYFRKGLALVPTIFGTHETHQWRGLKKRVLKKDILNGDYRQFFAQGGLYHGQ